MSNKSFFIALFRSRFIGTQPRSSRLVASVPRKPPASASSDLDTGDTHDGYSHLRHPGGGHRRSDAVAKHLGRRLRRPTDGHTRNGEHYSGGSSEHPRASHCRPARHGSNRASASTSIPQSLTTPGDRQTARPARCRFSATPTVFGGFAIRCGKTARPGLCGGAG